eukprot:609116-Prorocentrum_minimum.AAC.1
MINAEHPTSRRRDERSVVDISLVLVSSLKLEPSEQGNKGLYGSERRLLLLDDWENGCSGSVEVEGIRISARRCNKTMLASSSTII